MRLFICSLGLTILLAGCASSTSNHYTQSVQTWRGSQISTLISQWGKPDESIIAPNGDRTYLYKSQSTALNYPSFSPAQGVTYSKGGRPILTTSPTTNMSSSRGNTNSFCMAAFEVNAKGVIVSTQLLGNGCFGQTGFMPKKDTE